MIAILRNIDVALTDKLRDVNWAYLVHSQPFHLCLRTHYFDNSYQLDFITQEVTLFSSSFRIVSHTC